MSQNKHKILIAGGGFGGVKAALELCKDPRIQVRLISDDPNFSYFPSLYHTATGGSSEVSSIPLSEIFEDKDVEIIRDSVVDLDRNTRRVGVKSGKNYEYDSLILALGVVTNYFHIPGLEDFAYGIKSLEDAENFKRHLHEQLVEKNRPDQNYVIVGGGPTGIELAGVLGDYVRLICRKHGLGDRRVNIDLIEAAPRLVPRMPKDISKAIARQLRKRGVKLYFNAAVQAQTAGELMVGGKPITSETVIWTAGMSNHPFFAAHDFQLAKNGRVRTDQFLQAETGIYVIGDNNDTPYSGMAQTALYDGQYVAGNLIRAVDKEDLEPYNAKKPIYVLPAGPNWAAVLWSKVRLYGRAGWALRRVADFMAYRDYEPWFRATKHWLAENDTEEFCAYCGSEESTS